MNTNPMPTRPRTAPLVISVRGLTKTYADRCAVDHLDFDVHAGEIVGLIGANGAGKTTTVEILQGLRKPDSGSVQVLGLDPQREADRLRPMVGSQLQSSALPDRIRVHEAMRLFAGPDAADGDALLEQFGLTHRRKAPFGGMSGGEQQRLFLVLALLNRPRLVILDELTQGLDPAARREVWDAVRQLRDSGTTVLLVTHELDETERLCDRVIAMKHGRVLDQGTPADLVARHGGLVRISFSWPTEQPDLATLPGVQSVSRDGERQLVLGDRNAIAGVGAWLMRLGRPVPPDLRVDVPDLESALITLLDESETARKAA